MLVLFTVQKRQYIGRVTAAAPHSQGLLSILSHKSGSARRGVVLAAVHDFNKELLYKWPRRFGGLWKSQLSTFLPSLGLSLRQVIRSHREVPGHLYYSEYGWSSGPGILSAEELETLT